MFTIVICLLRPYGIEATTQTGISRSMEKRSYGENQSNTKFQETTRLHKTKNCQEDEFTQGTEFTIGCQRKNYKEYIHINYTINTGVRSITFGMMAPSKIDRLQVSQNQGMRLIHGVPRGTSAKMMRHELQM